MFVCCENVAGISVSEQNASSVGTNRVEVGCDELSCHKCDFDDKFDHTPDQLKVFVLSRSGHCLMPGKLLTLTIPQGYSHSKVAGVHTVDLGFTIPHRCIHGSTNG